MKPPEYLTGKIIYGPRLLGHIVTKELKTISEQSIKALNQEIKVIDCNSIIIINTMFWKQSHV